MTRSLHEIAAELAEKRQIKAQTELLKWQAGKDMEARLIELTPPEGWPGKNDGQRAAAKAKALAADDAYMTASDQADMAAGALFELDAQIAALEDERRAAEWEVRLRQVETLAAMIQNDHKSPDGQLFDGVVQNEVEEHILDYDPKFAARQQYLRQKYVAQPAPSNSGHPDEIPF